MFSRMPSSRALLATVLCAGLGLAAARVPVRAAPAHDVTLTVSTGPTITCRACQAADPVVPVAAVESPRPVAHVVAIPLEILVESAPRARVLDVAPKTSPPRA